MDPRMKYARYGTSWNGVNNQRNGRPRLDLPAQLRDFRRTFAPASFAEGTLKNKMTHLRAFREYLSTFVRKQMADADIYDLVAWGQKMAKDGHQKQVVSSYFETVRSFLIEQGNIGLGDMMLKYQHKWIQIVRMCVQEEPQRAPLITWETWQDLGSKTKRFLLLMFVLACRFSTAAAISTKQIVKKCLRRDACMYLQLTNIKHSPTGDARVAGIFCTCDPQETNFARRTSMCFFHAFQDVCVPVVPIDFQAQLERGNIKTHSVRRTIVTYFVKMWNAGEYPQLKTKKLYAWLRWTWSRDCDIGMLKIYAAGHTGVAMDMLPPIRNLVLCYCA